jgi:hypothetical protein
MVGDASFREGNGTEEIISGKYCSTESASLDS